MLPVQGLDLPPKRPGPGGSWDVAAVFARDGVQVYDDENGQPVREARPRSEVMRSAPLMRGIAVTLQHPGDGQDPDGGAGEVTPENARALLHGSILDAMPDWPAPGLLGGWQRLYSSEIQAAATAGTREQSVGYSAVLRDPRDPEVAHLVAELGPSPGVMHDGSGYDLIQTDIQPNHHAWVDQARAGPIATARVDGRAAMKTKIQINGKTHEIQPFMAKAIRADALDAAGVAKAKVDALEVGEMMIEGQQLIVPQATIDQIIAMLGGSAGPSVPEPDPMPLDAAPPGMPPRDPMMADADDKEDAGDMPPKKADAADIAAQVQRLVADALAKALPQATRRIADAVTTTTRERAILERDASLVLGTRHDYAGQDDCAIACAVLKADGSPKVNVAEALAAQARKGDAVARGRLLQMMDTALDARRDGEDTTGALALALFQAGPAGRTDAADDETPERVRVAQAKRTDAQKPKTRATA